MKEEKCWLLLYSSVIYCLPSPVLVTNRIKIKRNGLPSKDVLVCLKGQHKQ